MIARKIGVMLTDLRPSQQAYYAIQQMNLVVKNTDFDCAGFIEYGRFPPCSPTLFGTMDMAEIWSYDGILISTTLSHTRLNINALNQAKKIFYVWDLEWLRGKKDFIENLSIYQSPKVDIICRSEDHAKAFKNYTNREPNLVVPNFNLSEIINAYFQ